MPHEPGHTRFQELLERQKSNRLEQQEPLLSREQVLGNVAPRPTAETPEVVAEQESVVSKIADTVIGAGPFVPLILPALAAEAVSPGNRFSELLRD